MYLIINKEHMYHSKKIFIDIVNPSNSERIIDVGSGSGDLVLEIQKKYSNVRLP